MAQDCPREGGRTLPVPLGICQLTGPWRNTCSPVDHEVWGQLLGEPCTPPPLLAACQVHWAFCTPTASSLSRGIELSTCLLSESPCHQEVNIKVSVSNPVGSARLPGSVPLADQGSGQRAGQKQEVGLHACTVAAGILTAQVLCVGRGTA